MTEAEIESKVIDIVAEQMGVDKATITRETNFTNDLHADSLDTVELVMEFEDEFETSIPDDEAEKIQTVGQASDYIKKAERSQDVADNDLKYARKLLDAYQRLEQHAAATLKIIEQSIQDDRPALNDTSRRSSGRRMSHSVAGGNPDPKLGGRRTRRQAEEVSRARGACAE